MRGLGEHELILVDDGSTDGTWEALLGLARADRHVRLIRLSRNFGHQLALSAGLEAARGDAVVSIDADLQDPPELIPELVATVARGLRRRLRGPPAARGRVAVQARNRILFYKGINRLSSTEIPEQAGDFRLLSRRALDALLAMPERSRFLRGMSTWIGFRQVGVPYARDARFAGETKYPLRKMARLATDAVTSFSTAPIRMVFTLGLIAVAFCLRRAGLDALPAVLHRQHDPGVDVGARGGALPRRGPAREHRHHWAVRWSDLRRGERQAVVPGGGDRRAWELGAMTRTVVTGGAGFLGSRLVERLEKGGSRRVRPASA